MEKLYEQSKCLALEAEKISEQIFNHHSNKCTEEVLQAIAQLMYKYSALRIDLMKREKK